MRKCDVPRAADMSMDVFAAFREHDEVTAADCIFALAMAAAVLAADAPPAERAALAAAIGLLTLDCLPLAVERLATPRVLH